MAGRLNWVALSIGSIVGAVVVFAGLATASPSKTSRETQEKVSVQLDWVPRGEHAAIYVGQKRGIFAKHGIAITSINPGKGSSLTMQLVGKGGADFGFGDLPTMAVARSQGIPIKAILASGERSPLAFCSLADKHPLREPSDMKGLNMLVDPGGSTFVFYRAFLAANGLSRSDFHERTVTPPYENFLLKGRVDVIPCYIDAEVPVLRAHTQGKLSILLGSDWGYKVLGSGLVTSDEMMKEHPGTVQNFVSAYLETFRWVIAHPKQAAQIVAAARPETHGQAGIFYNQLKEDIAHVFTSAVTKVHGLGYMSPAAWKTTVTTLAKQKVIKKVPSLSSLYTDRFVQNAARR